MKEGISAVLTAAYGRRYLSITEAVAAYKGGKDWIYHNPSSVYNGKYTSIRDFKNEKVELRYGSNHQHSVII